MAMMKVTLTLIFFGLISLTSIPQASAATDYEGKYVCGGKILHIPSLIVPGDAVKRFSTLATMTFVVKDDETLTGRIESDIFSEDVEGTFKPTATAPVVNRMVTTRAKIKLPTPNEIFPQEIKWDRFTFIPAGPYQRRGATNIRFRASGHSYLTGSMSLPAREGKIGTDILSLTCNPPVKEEVVEAPSPSEG